MLLPTSETHRSAPPFRRLAGGAQFRTLRSVPKHEHEAAFIIERYGKRKQRGNVLGITQNFSMRIAAKGLLCVTVTISVLLGTLVLAGSASAAEPVGEQAPEPTTPVVPITEQAPEPTTPVVPITEQTKEVAPTEPITKQVAESPPSSPSAAPQDAAMSGNPSVPAAAEVPSTPIGSLATGPTAGDPGDPPTTSAARPASIGAPVPLSAAQRAGDLTCELSGLAGPATDNCTTSWLGGRSFLSLSASPADLATVAAARAGAPADGGNGGSGSGGGGRSVVPPPAPTPSGAFGGAAMGSSGIAVSGFFTLADRLLLAAPLAMRRLRLSCQPWLTAFFVLIPERPG